MAAIKPGIRQTHCIKGYTVDIVWTYHIVQRIRQPERLVTPELIDVISYRGIRDIVNLVSYKKYIEGIIRSSTTNLNIMFAAALRGKKITVTLKSAIVMERFIPKLFRDYVIPVNPPWRIVFKCGIDSVRRELVIENILKWIKRARGTKFRDIRYELIIWTDGFVDYKFKLKGNDILVTYAGWAPSAEIIKVA